MGGGMLWRSSAASRVRMLMPVVSSLEDAIIALGDLKLTVRDAERAAADIRTAGRRFAYELPEKPAELYALVAERMPGHVARLVTGYLLEGAGRRGVR